MDQAKVQLITQVLWSLLQLILAGIATYLLPKLPALTAHFLEWSKHKAQDTKNTYVAGVLQRIVDLIGQKVLMVENTVIEDLKDKAKDGKLTQEELKECLAKAKQTVIDAVKSDANAQGLWNLALTVFLGDENALGKWIGDTIEATVAKLPPSGLQSPKHSVTGTLIPAAMKVPAVP